MAGTSTIEVLEPVGKFSWYMRDLAVAIEREGLAMRPGETPGRVGGFVARALSRTQLVARLWRAEPTLVVFGGNRGIGEWLPTALRHEIVPILTDCWPSTWGFWSSILRKLRVRTAFVSARQSAEHLAAAVPGLHTIWHPESIDPSAYHPGRPIAERSIDLLEFGRPHPEFHDRVRERLAGTSLAHKFPDPTKHVHHQFPERADLHRAQGDAKLLACFPRSATHPDLAQGVETMTLRYLEAFASGAVPIGVMPRELVDLFGYVPGVEVSAEGDPSHAVLAALEDPGRLQELATRNLGRLGEVATCSVRAKETVEHLRDRGYGSSRA